MGTPTKARPPTSIDFLSQEASVGILSSYQKKVIFF